MKKLINMITAMFVLFALISCSQDISDGSRAAASRDSGTVDTITVYYKNPSGKTATNFWVWGDVTETVKTACSSWDAAGGGVQTTTSDKTGFSKVVIEITKDCKSISFIPRDDAHNKLAGNDDIVFLLAFKYDTIYVSSNGKKFYSDDALTTECSGLTGAVIKDETTIQLQGIITLTQEGVSVEDDDGNALTIESVSATAKTITIEDLKDQFLTNGPLTVTLGEDEATVEFNTDLIDTWFPNAKDEEGLGVTIKTDGTASFKMFAPTASEVKLLLFSDAAAAGTKNDKQGWATQPTEPESDSIIKMTSKDGFWSADNIIVSGKKYYKYRVTAGGETKDVADIWAYAASADSVASQIIDINSPDVKGDFEGSYTNPFGDSGSETKKYSDAVIYEMHIRDWSGAGYDAGGSFEDFASDKNIDHLKDLGVTHVQILPMFDYAQTKADTAYNWGYNPYHYNVPESRYTKNATEGVDAVKQMRAMIKKLHDEGIAVIMDVVYNHTSGTGDGSLYDMTIPQYFYRMTNGAYSNGSGCGNEVATNHLMVKKYVIDSLKHWMNDYHINGFRFDLMGVEEASTMKEIYDELYKIDKNVLVYGEPWTGGTSAVEKGAVAAGTGTSGYGYGAFNDDFRDGIKGGEFGGFQRGIVNGNLTDNRVLAGLLGDASAGNKRNATGVKGLTLCYAECHDNYTLFDKLLYSFDTTNVKDKGPKGNEEFVEYFKPLYDKLPTYIDQIKAQDKLVAAFVLLAQGTPFLNGGQDFLRTKQGNPDSYSADKKGGHQWTEAEIKTCNLVDLSMKETYADVYTTYRGLIAFRQDNLDAFSSNTSATTTMVKDGLVKYTAGSYVIYYNCTDNAQSINETGKVVDVNNNLKIRGYNALIVHSTSFGVSDKKYTVGSTSETVKSVAAKSFVIIKK